MNAVENEFWEMPGASHLSEALTSDECWGLLTTQQTGRIGFLRDGSIYIFPVNYLGHDDGIYFRTSETSEIGRNALENVAFQADLAKPAQKSGWTVLAQGSAKPIEDETLLTVLWGRVAEEPWTGGSRNRFIARTPRTLSYVPLSGGVFSTPWGTVLSIMLP